MLGDPWPRDVAHARAPRALSQTSCRIRRVSPQLVEELLRQLARSIKTHQLYLPNNPIYQRAIENLRAAFAPIWPHTPRDRALDHRSRVPLVRRAASMHEANRSESLPWLFFKDGVRELTLTQGIEDDELVALLRILQRVRKAAPKRMTSSRCCGSRTSRASSTASSTSISIRTRRSMRRPSRRRSARFRSSTTSAPRKKRAQPERKSGIVNMADFDATLYFLDENEIDYLRAASGAEQTIDMPQERAGDSARHLRGAGERQGARGNLRHPRELHAESARRRLVPLRRVPAARDRDRDRPRSGAHACAQAAAARAADEPQRSVPCCRSCSRRSISRDVASAAGGARRSCSSSCAAACSAPCSAGSSRRRSRSCAPRSSARRGEWQRRTAAS